MPALPPVLHCPAVVSMRDLFPQHERVIKEVTFGQGGLSRARKRLSKELAVEELAVASILPWLKLGIGWIIVLVGDSTRMLIIT